MDTLKTYKHKFYLNASHYVTFNERQGDKHPHTWELTYTIVGTEKRFSNFNILKEKIETILETYQDKCLNDLFDFQKEQPTTENILHVLSKKIQEELKKDGWLIVLAEISENPTCSYFVDYSKIKKNPKIAYGYRYTTYLNAAHTTFFTNNANTHNHSWEFSIRFVTKNKQYVNFATIKETVNDVLEDFQNRNLNDLHVFHDTIPTMENIIPILVNEIQQDIEKEGLFPIWAEINENSFCSYFIDKTNI